MKDFSPSCVPEIKQRTAFQVGNRLFKTPQAAAKNIAWSWIFHKYGGMKNTQHPSIEDIKKILDMECCCMVEPEVDDWGRVEKFPSDLCPIHDRNNGWIKRLHKRCVDKILKAWDINHE